MAEPYPEWSQITSKPWYKDAKQDERSRMASAWADGMQASMEEEHGPFSPEQVSALRGVLAQQAPDLQPRSTALKQDPTAKPILDALTYVSPLATIIRDKPIQQAVLQLRQAGNLVQGDFEELADVSSRLRAIPPSDAMVRFSQADTVSDLSGAFFSNPLNILTNIVAQSLVTSAGSIALGAAGGAAAGAATANPLGAAIGTGLGIFSGSSITEGTLKYLEEVQKGGVDLTDADQLATFFEQSTPEAKALHNKAKKKGAVKGLTIGAFDGATGLLAGRIFRAVSSVKRVQDAADAVRAAGTTAERTAAMKALDEAQALVPDRIRPAIAAEVGVDAILGGAGEAVGSRLAGDEATLGEIAAEAIGGPLIGGPFAFREVGQGLGLTDDDIALISSLDQFNQEMTTQQAVREDPTIAEQVVQEEPAPTPPEPAPVETEPVAETVTVETPASDIRLGAFRDPVVDPQLRALSPSDFENHLQDVTESLDKIEEQFDEWEGAIQDFPLKAEMAAAQDVFTAADLEAFRRSMQLREPDSLRFTLMQLNLKLPGDKIRAQMIAEAVRDRGLSEEFRQTFVEFAQRSPDHAEVAENVIRSIQNVEPSAPVLDPVQMEAVTQRLTEGELAPEEIKALLPRVQDENLRSEMQAQLDFLEDTDDVLLHPPTDRPIMPLAEPQQDEQTTGDLRARFRKGREIGSVVRELERAFDVPIRTGKFREKALGIFKPREKVVRTELFGDMQIIGHEIGHAIDKDLDLSADADLRSELMSEDLGQRTSDETYTDRQVAREGFAEFFRILLTNEELSRKVAPKTYNTFVQRLGTDKKLADAVQLARMRYAEMLSQNGLERIASTIAWSPDDKGSDTVQRLMIDWIDRLYPLKQMTLEAYDGNAPGIFKDAHMMGQLASGSSSKAFAWIEDGIRNSAGEIMTEGLMPVISEIHEAGMMDEFQTYLKSRRIVDNLADRGLATQEEVTAAEQAVSIHEARNPQAREWSDRVFAFSKGLLESMRAAGVITEEDFRRIDSVSDSYTPFHRVVEESFGAGERLVKNMGKPVKRIGESNQLPTIPPLEALMQNAFTVATAVDRQRVMNAVADMADLDGKGFLIEKLPPPPKRPATIEVKSIIESLVRQGIIDAKDVKANEDLAETFLNVYNRSGKYGNDESIISRVNAEGNREYFRVKDRATMEAILNSSPEVSSLNVGILTALSKVLRETATLSLGFLIRNPVRDTVTAGINSKSGFIPVIDSTVGMMHVLSDQFGSPTETIKRFKGAGVSGANFFALDQEQQRRVIARQSKQGLAKLVDNTLLHPLDFMRAISNALENSTRVGEFIKAERKAVRDLGMTPEEAYSYANYSAREVTLDFSRGGHTARYWNRYRAFFNAMILGQEKMVRQLREDPTGTLTRIAFMITLPTVLSHLQMKDDEEYEEVPDWEKDAYWHFRIPGVESLLRIPKPHGYGFTFGTVAQRALNAIEGDPSNELNKLTSSLGRDALQMVVLSAIPTAVLPIASVTANYDFFRQAEIVNTFDESIPVEERSNRWTGETAKQLARFVHDNTGIGISPVHIEFMVHGHTAGMGRFALDSIDSVIKDPNASSTPTKDTSQRIPGLSVFVTANPRGSSQSIRDVYEILEAGSQARQRIKIARGRGETERAAELKERDSDLVRRGRRMERAAKRMKPIWKRIRAVYDSPTMTSDEKRDKLDRLYERLVKIARNATGREGGQ